MNKNTPNAVKYVTPEEKDLRSIQNSVQCSYESCKKTFSGPSKLALHTAQCHLRVSYSSTFDKRETFLYHCPISNCIYNECGPTGVRGKSFKRKGHLKQHYLKVHAAKTISCEACGKCFAAQLFLNAHRRSCGKIFVCFCGSTLSTAEGYATHVRRHGQKKEKQEDCDSTTSLEEKRDWSLLQDTELSPKSKNQRMMAAIALSELASGSSRPVMVDAAIQTDQYSKRARRSSIQSTKKSQALEAKRRKKQTVQTQTKLTNLKTKSPRSTTGSRVSKGTNLSDAFCRNSEMIDESNFSGSYSASRTLDNRCPTFGSSSQSVSTTSGVSSQLETSNSNTPSLENSSSKRNIDIFVRDIFSPSCSQTYFVLPHSSVNKSNKYENQKITNHSSTKKETPNERFIPIRLPSGYLSSELNPITRQNYRTKYTADSWPSSSVCGSEIDTSDHGSSVCDVSSNKADEQLDSKLFIPVDLEASHVEGASKEEILGGPTADSSNGARTNLKLSCIDIDNDFDAYIESSFTTSSTQTSPRARHNVGSLTDRDFYSCSSSAHLLTDGDPFPPAVASPTPPPLQSHQLNTIRSSSIETQTDLFEDLGENGRYLPTVDTTSEPSFWCTSETQTWEDFDQIEPYLYSHKNTQTYCSDDLYNELFPELNFGRSASYSNIHTQTD